MTEEEIIKKLNTLFPSMEELVKCEDEYSHYDCENDTYIMEIKSRDRHYDPWLIQRDKFVSNYDKSIETGKEFIYLTEYKTKIITWNINDLVASGYDFGWEVREMPETTEFEQTEPILKEVGYLYEQYGKKI
mgnify:FL=1